MNEKVTLFSCMPVFVWCRQLWRALVAEDPRERQPDYRTWLPSLPVAVNSFSCRSPAQLPCAVCFVSSISAASCVCGVTGRSLLSVCA